MAKRKGKGKGAQQQRGRTAKLATSREVYNRVRWDAGLDAQAYEVVYEDHTRGEVSVPLMEFVPDGDIPWHRVWRVLERGEVVWDREARVDLVCGTGRSGQARPARDASVASAAPEGDDGTVWESGVGWRYSETLGAWREVTPEDDANPRGLMHVPGLLKLATLNVLMPFHKPEALDTERRTAALVAWLDRCGADVVVLCEVTPPVWASLLEAAVVRAGFDVSEGPGAEGLVRYGQAILTRGRLTEVATHRFSRDKRAVLGRVACAGVMLDVAAVHLTSNLAAHSAQTRVRQLRVVLDAIDRRTGPAQAVQSGAVVMGDFNTRDEAELDVARGRGWVDVWSAAGRRDEDGRTFDPTRNSLAALMSRSGQPWRYDRMLARGPGAELGVVRAEMTCRAPLEGEGPEALGAPLYVSDHFALEAWVRTPSVMAPALGAAPTSRSAAVVCPPEALWGPIQALREAHDPSFTRWMPHINLLYGCLPEAGQDAAARVLRAVLAEIEPFEVVLEEVGSFVHRASGSVWLRPRSVPEGALERLQGVLERALPQCSEQSGRGESGYTPHLTVAVAQRPEQTERLRREVERGWAPMRFWVDRVALIHRGATTPFEVCHTLMLGAPPEREPGQMTLDALDTRLDRAGAYGDEEARLARLAALEGIQGVAHAAALAMGLRGVGEPAELTQAAGSMRLGVDVRGSDVDVLCAVPKDTDPEDFLDAVADVAARAPEASGLRHLVGEWGARLMLAWDGVEVDVQVAPVLDPVRGIRPALWGWWVLAPEERPPSLRSVLDAERLAQRLGGWLPGDDWRHLLRAVRVWARSKQLDEAALGYLGGISWATLTAWAALNPSPLDSRRPAALVLRDVFARLNDTPTRHIFALDDDARRSPEAQGPKALLPVLAPTRPWINTARHVTRSTRRVLRRAWRESAEQLDAIAHGALGWEAWTTPLTAPSDAPWLELRLIDGPNPSPNTRRTAEGWLRGNMLGLIIDLERSKVIQLRPCRLNGAIALIVEAPVAAEWEDVAQHVQAWTARFDVAFERQRDAVRLEASWRTPQA